MSCEGCQFNCKTIDDVHNVAKLWKKVLLAICIVACIFNIMSKLVSKTSLELNLKSVENGESILTVLKDKKEELKNSEDATAENKVENKLENTLQNTVIKDTEKTNISDFVVIY